MIGDCITPSDAETPHTIDDEDVAEHSENEGSEEHSPGTGAVSERGINHS